MARIRSIKPEFWTSEQVVECSRDARLVFIGMWNFCDDAGRHPASIKRLKMEVLPGDAASTDEVTRWVRELVDNELIEEYEFDGQAYWEITGWRHQKIDQPNIRHPSRDGSMDQVRVRRLGGKQRSLMLKRLTERDGEKCCNCGSEKTLTIDHIIPVSRGGTNEQENLQILCKLCNNEKCAKVLASDAAGTETVRDGDAPPDGNGVEGSVIGEEGKGKDVSRPRTPAITAAGVPLPDGWQNTPELLAALGEWLEHKHGKGERYKSAESVGKMLTTFANRYGTNAQRTFLESVPFSIGNNYSGCFAPKDSRPQAERVGDGQRHNPQGTLSWRNKS